MSQAVVRLRAESSPAEYLGPAEVTEVTVPELQVRLESGATVRAVMALALPYAPALGDVLLVIGRAERHYVIGVLAGSGRTSLAFQGDVDVAAIGGALNLSGDRGVSLRGPEVSLEADKLTMFGDALVQKFASVVQRVTSLLRVHAGETQTLVDEASVTQAKSAVIQTEKTVTINGREIHLG